MESHLEGKREECPHCGKESEWINLIEEEDISPILPECTCKRIRRILGQWRNQLRNVFKKNN